MPVRSAPDFARRAMRAWPPCANCPSCYFVAGGGACAVGQIRCIGSDVLSHRGALRNVINAGWDAVDALVSQDELRQCVRRNRVVLISRR